MIFTARFISLTLSMYIPSFNDDNFICEFVSRSSCTILPVRSKISTTEFVDTPSN
jgi:hypothetical protein